MIQPVKHYNDFSISATLLRQYQAMSMEKRLEWLYLGNVLRKAFSEMMDKEALNAGEQKEDKI